MSMLKYSQFAFLFLITALAGQVFGIGSGAATELTSDEAASAWGAGSDCGTAVYTVTFGCTGTNCTRSRNTAIVPGMGSKSANVFCLYLSGINWFPCGNVDVATSCDN